MTLDDIIQNFRTELAADQRRADAIKDSARERHGKSVARADAARERAVTEADETLRRVVATTETTSAEVNAKAEHRFDEACRELYGVDPSAVIKAPHAHKIEMWLRTGHAPVAEATYIGPAGWALDTGTGRSFLGSDGTAARAGLWRFAASIPVPR